jgi:hypothetical protein
MTQSLTVQQVIDMILKEIPAVSKTVDTLNRVMASKSYRRCYDYVRTEAIRRTASLGANFIIAHEPRSIIIWMKPRG